MRSTRRFRTVFARRALAATMLLAPACAPAQSPYEAGVPPLRGAVETHLAAIAVRDTTALLPTLTRGDTLTMIAPNGFKLDTRQQYLDFHRQWFATKDDGRYEAEIVRLVESPALGHALVKYRYRFKNSNGQPETIDAWLALTFALEDGAWRLVFDQNTALTPPS